MGERDGGWAGKEYLMKNEQPKTVHGWAAGGHRADRDHQLSRRGRCSGEFLQERGVHSPLPEERCATAVYSRVPGHRNWRIETADWIWLVSSTVL